MGIDPGHLQDDYDVRFEWGPDGVAAHAPGSAAVVIVDVLRFSTAVDAAVARGIAVYPTPRHDEGARTLAAAVGARLAEVSEPSGPSLSPLSFAGLEGGSAVVLPSPNGSACAALAAESGAVVAAGCLRNADALSAWLAGRRPVSVIACGERWPGGSLRPCLEDLLGAGAVLAGLDGARSPEAEAAVAAWSAARAHDLARLLADCASGRELVGKGRGADVAYASALDASRCVPVLSNGCFVDAAAFS
jgi:2-phosphosulfolactate phosphatase